MNDTCKSCNNDTFSEGKLADYAALRPLHKALASGSPMIFKFCAKCGEVASIKVEKPEKFNK